jgi:hypothetical protein
VNRIKLLLLGVGVTTLAAGCTEDIASSDVRTSGVYADYTALASKGEPSDSGTKASAYLRTGGDNSNTFLDLVGDDKLVITVGDESRELTGEERTGDFAEDAEDTLITFAWMRGEEDVSAPNSTVTLPPEFTPTLEGITLVDGEDPEIPRSAPLVISWEGASTSDQVNYHIEGDCLFLETGEESSNDGSITIDADEFNVTGDDEAATCGAKLYVELVRKGTLDENLEGSITATRRVWIPFVSVP